MPPQVARSPPGAPELWPQFLSGAPHTVPASSQPENPVHRPTPGSARLTRPGGLGGGGRLAVRAHTSHLLAPTGAAELPNVLIRSVNGACEPRPRRQRPQSCRERVAAVNQPAGQAGPAPLTAKACSREQLCFIKAAAAAAGAGVRRAGRRALPRPGRKRPLQESWAGGSPCRRPPPAQAPCPASGKGGGGVLCGCLQPGGLRP